MSYSISPSIYVIVGFVLILYLCLSYVLLSYFWTMLRTSFERKRERNKTMKSVLYSAIVQAHVTHSILSDFVSFGFEWFIVLETSISSIYDSGKILMRTIGQFQRELEVDIIHSNFVWFLDSIKKMIISFLRINLISSYSVILLFNAPIL